MMKKIEDFLKEQECYYVKVVTFNKTYFCEYMPVTVNWYGKPVDVGVKFKEKCIAGSEDGIEFDAKSPLYSPDTVTNGFGWKLWEEVHEERAIDIIDEDARADWLLACAAE